MVVADKRLFGSKPNRKLKLSKMKIETEPKTEKYGKWKPKAETEKPKLIWFDSVFGKICPPLPATFFVLLGI